MKYVFLIVTLTPWFLAGCVTTSEPEYQPNDKLAGIRARGTLIIATNADYPPQFRLLSGVLPAQDTKREPTQYTANQFSGFDVSVAVETARNLGVESCFITPSWSQLVAGNWGDNWDVHVGSMAIVLDRVKVFYFSQPYYATPTIVLVHEGNNHLSKSQGFIRQTYWRVRRVYLRRVFERYVENA